MFVLGINSAYHESASCLLQQGKLVSASEEERFTRMKHGKSARVDNPDMLPLLSIQNCLERAGITLRDVEAIGFSLDPRRRLANKTIVEPKDDNDWGGQAGEETYFRKLSTIPGKLQEMGFRGRFEWIPHHVCHAASAYFSTSFEDAAVLVVDGIGEVALTMFLHAQGNQMEVLRELNYPASIGFLWEKLCKFLGFSEYDACKMMGLAAYGDPRRYERQLDTLLWETPEGGFSANSDLLRFRVEDYEPLERLFDVPRRARGTDLGQPYRDVAAALQEKTNRLMRHMVTHLAERTGSRNLCMAGGVALNCVTNRFIFEQGPFNNLFIQPAAHDAGTAIGAAQFLWHSLLGNAARTVPEPVYLGASFSAAQVQQALVASTVPHQWVEDIEARVARLVSERNIVGWFQGGMEFGPRALGNRSLLADPRDPNMREILNVRTKHREEFRPFAGSILAEEVDNWFQIRKYTPSAEFMLLTYPVRPEKKALIPAVLHVDGTCRIQVVRRDANPRYHRLISEFQRLTGVPIVLNTSFNDSEPIVCTPQDALNTFQRTKIDYVAMDNYLASRS